MMIHKRWNSDAKAYQSNEDHSTYKVLAFLYEIKHKLFRKQNVSDKSSLQCLEANSHDNSCCLGSYSLIDGQIHELKLIFCWVFLALNGL